ncbi:MAG: hypothetical protein NTU79_17250 [Planctomycetota bacterium]|nr:hypothetical protein [Planctomycetota bacterium]
MINLKAIAFFGLTAFPISRMVADDWPMWRGQRGDGISLETNAPLEWSPTKNIRWKVSIPGNGSTVIANSPNYEVLAKNSLDELVQASPAISEGAIYVRGERSLWKIESSAVGSSPSR